VTLGAEPPEAKLVQPAPSIRPDVSVIIAAYNAEDFLHFAIESVRRQAAPRRRVEIIIVDDASPDNTARVAADLCATHDDLQVVRLEQNGEPSAARNAGLDVARGEWIAVLDADDAFEPDHLDPLLSVGERAGADIVLGNICFYDLETGTRFNSGLSLPRRQPVWSASDYVRRAQPLTGRVDWGLLKPIFRRTFMKEREIRYTLYSRHGEDFLLILGCAEKKSEADRVSRSHLTVYYSQFGWSRTKIDYGAQVDQARALINQPVVQDWCASSSSFRCPSRCSSIGVRCRLSAARAAGVSAWYSTMAERFAEEAWGLRWSLRKFSRLARRYTLPLCCCSG